MKNPMASYPSGSGPARRREDPVMFDMHVHSLYSDDSVIPVYDIVRTWKTRNIYSIVCDHDTIRGSVEVCRELTALDSDIPVIIAEEILTSDGDIIGVFLNEEIKPGMTAMETLDAIHAQGGLSLLPHPFSSSRCSSIRSGVLDEVIERIDIVEGFNGKRMRAGENHTAGEYGQAHNKALSVGSDAHVSCELGQYSMRVEAFDGPGEFLGAVRKASFAREFIVQPAFRKAPSLPGLHTTGCGRNTC